MSNASSRDYFGDESGAIEEYASLIHPKKLEHIRQYADLCERSAHNILTIADTLKWEKLHKIVSLIEYGLEYAGLLVLSRLNRDLQRYCEKFSDVEMWAEKINQHQSCRLCEKPRLGKEESLRIAQEAIYQWGPYTEGYFRTHEWLCPDCESWRGMIELEPMEELERPGA